MPGQPAVFKPNKWPISPKYAVTDAPREPAGGAAAQAGHMVADRKEKTESTEVFIGQDRATTNALWVIRLTLW